MSQEIRQVSLTHELLNPADYYCIMDKSRRVCLVIEGHEPVNQVIYSSMKSMMEHEDIDLSYRALISRLHRAKSIKGKQSIKLKNRNGDPITIEIRPIE